MRRGFFIVVLLMICLAIPANAWGCAVCYSDPDSSQAQGLNRAILVLLSIIGTVQVGFVAMFVQFRRRARDQQPTDDLLEGQALKDQSLKDQQRSSR